MDLVAMDPIPVMYVRAPGGSTGASEAFRRLEATLADLRGRKVYATTHAGEYRACVALHEGDDPVAVGLERGEIPGGTYVQMRLQGALDDIPKGFATLAHALVEDTTRPRVECYARHDRVMLMLPVTP